MDPSEEPHPEPARLTRVQPPHSTEREIWAKAAGRCVMCAAYLLSASWGYDVYAVGQVAHAVGATNAPGSPRGQSPLTAEQRAHASNLMLLCYACHQKADRDPDHYPVEQLLKIKNNFEARVRSVTNFASLEPTVVIRLTAPIRGRQATITDAQVSEALRHSRLSYDGEDVRASTERIEISDPEDAIGVWETASARIARQVERAMRTFEEGKAESVSVFGLAPIPMLVKLGAEVGNKRSAHIFQAHRVGDRYDWQWPDTPNPPAEFHSTIAGNTTRDSAEELLVCFSLTAAVQLERVPRRIRELPRLDISVAADDATGMIDSSASLLAFARAWREGLQTLEDAFPKAQRLHVVAAVPVSAAIEIGRQRMPDAHPQLVVYQLTEEQQYVPVISVG